ncbi:MAG: hypothetical protein J0L72_07785 [Armatimonadetes bacterium]|nr:hypothetical protein [Armatimonadota bacterium]
MISVALSALLLSAPPNPTQVQIMSSVSTFKAGEPFWVGVKVEIEEGWHTYYKNPGDSGLGTTVEWALPKGWKVSELKYPAPHKILLDGTITFGYEKEVVYLAQITPPAQISEHHVNIRGDVAMLVCLDSCLPADATVSLSLPRTDEAATRTENYSALQAILATTPTKYPSTRQASYELHDETMTFWVPKVANADLSKYTFIADAPAVVDHKDPVTKVTAVKDLWKIEVKRSEFLVKGPDAINGAFYYLDEHGAPKNRGFAISLKRKD